VVLAVNKMDLVSFSQETFNSIEKDYEEFAKHIGLKKIQAIDTPLHVAEQRDPKGL